METGDWRLRARFFKIPSLLVSNSATITMVKNAHTHTTNGRFLAVFILFIILFGLGLGIVNAQEVNLPLTPPNAANGLAVFAERCANCHGPTGGGDGELATQLLVQPRQLNDPNFGNTAVPGTIFGHITNGILESGMPPFGPASSDPLDDAARWDLVAAIYSFSASETSIGMGEAVYEANCLACHGADGQGDGSNNANLDLTRLNYWFNRSNETVMADIPGAVPEHDFELGEMEVTAVVNYARTFSYVYASPSALTEPIEGAAVSGQVTNGATGEVVTEGEARLRAFNTSFQETMNITTTVDVDGRYQFNLPAVEPDWIFLASVTYKELGFSSDAGQLSRSQPTLELPIIVYEATTDPAAIAFEQVHLVLGFQGDVMQVSELYVIDNRATAVFVGESGNPELGTIQINLPEGAENPIFERTLGSMESTIPATEVIQTDTGWADTLPMHPGAGGLNLIVTYFLPYEDGMTLSHSLPYPADSANIIMPDVGVTVKGGAWEFQGGQEMPGGGGSFLSYAQAGLQAGDELTMQFEGEPTASAASVGGNTVAPRNSTNELLIGGGILLIVIVAGIFLYQNWQSPSYADEYEYDEYEESDEAAHLSQVDQLLQAIADLDEAHERGETNDDDYASQREQLKAELRTLWQ